MSFNLDPFGDDDFSDLTIEADKYVVRYVFKPEHASDFIEKHTIKTTGEVCQPNVIQMIYTELEDIKIDINVYRDAIEDAVGFVNGQVIALSES